MNETRPTLSTPQTRPAEYTTLAVEFIEPAGILLPAAIRCASVAYGRPGRSILVPDWSLAPFAAATPQADEAAARLARVTPQEWDELLRRPGGRTALDTDPLYHGQYPIERLRMAWSQLAIAREYGVGLVVHTDVPGLACLARAFEVWLGQPFEFNVLARTGPLEVALRRGQRPRPGEALDAFVRRVGADAEAAPDLNACLETRGLVAAVRRYHPASAEVAIHLLFERQLDDIYGPSSTTGD